MATPKPPLPEWSAYVTFLGQFISGDLDGYTIYTTRRGKIIYYPEAPALEPPSALQKKQRARFQVAQANWSITSPTIKATWELLVKRLSLPLTGQNLWISLSMKPDDSGLANAAARAHLTLTPPPIVPA